MLNKWTGAGRDALEHRRVCAVRVLSGGVAGIVESDEFLAPGRTCDFGRLRPLALHRVPPAGPEGGFFRGDGFGDEYGGGRCWRFDECGVRKVVGERSRTLSALID